MTNKRKKYKPREVIIDPLVLMRPGTKSERERVMLIFRTAFEAIRCGKHPGNQEWCDLADAVNTVETLVLKKKLTAEGVMGRVEAAASSMAAAAERYKAGQSMRLDAAGLQALGDVLEIYEQCLRLLTAHEVRQATDETQKRMREYLRRPNFGYEVISL